MSELDKFLQNYRNTAHKMSLSMYSMLNHDGGVPETTITALADFTTDEVMKVVPSVVQGIFSDEDLACMNKVYVDMQSKCLDFEKAIQAEFEVLGNNPAFSAKLEAIVASSLDNGDVPTTTH